MLYAELLARTHYSFLRGASHPHEMIDRAAELGLAAIGIVDRDGVYGIPKSYLALKKHPKLKLITGAELTLTGFPRLFLLARNRKGYALLCRLLTASHEGQEKGKATLLWYTFISLLAVYPEGAQGLFVIPEAGQFLSEEFYRTLKKYFPDRVYLPLGRFLDGKDEQRTEGALHLSAHFDLPIVATNEAHFHLPSVKPLHDVVTAIREIIPVQKLGFKSFSNQERYLKSPAQMRRLFSDLPEAIENTLLIAQDCTFSPAELRYHYPSEWIPKGESAQSFLEKKTWEGAAFRYPLGVPENVRQQIGEEFALIDKMKFADYFLTIWEIVEYAKRQKILFQGRGSAANSVVCYCLGITAIDPVQMKLLFARFISEERGEPPDIDVDFEHERREEVIQYIYEKYGRHRAGMVAALVTYRTKSALRDVSKALELSPGDPKLTPLLEQISGFPRHLSIHSGGFTLSAEPIIETVPIEPARMEGRTIVQWDKNDLDAIGLLKVDILALGMLTALRKTFDLIAPKKALTLATVPHDDAKTYAMIQKGETVGVFQIESRAQMGMLRRLLPKTFYDLVIEVAIVRPGPIVGEMVHPFLKRRRGLEAIESYHPDLDSILSRTLGVPIFQEQIMQISITMAGFTPGEADELRRAIGAWRSMGSIEKMGRRLMDGLLKRGLPREFVERIFKQIQGFAEYGFPESHAASFALLAYASSYLKCHYPLEFVCALVNSQPMGFYSNHTLIDEAKRAGVKVLPIDPNRSEWDCTLEDGSLRLGLRIVNGLGEKVARHLVLERKRKLFSGLSDFLARVSLPPKALNHLAMGNAFQEFGLAPREALWQILSDQMLNHLSATAFQMSLFSGQANFSKGGEIFAPLGDYGAIAADYQAYGLSVRGHPMEALRKIKEYGIPTVTSAMLKHGGKNRQTVRVGGMLIVRQRPSTAKGTVFATLEDEEGFLDLILRSETYEKFRDVFNEDPFLIVEGRLQKAENLTNIIVNTVRAMRGPEQGLRVGSRDFH